MKREIFIHIPKTGGSSFVKSMNMKNENFKLHPTVEKKHTGIFVQKEIDSLKHRRLKFEGSYGHVKIDEIYEKKELENFKIYTLVRNPYSRFVSLWMYLKRRSKRTKNSNKIIDFTKLVIESFNSEDLTVFEDEQVFPPKPGLFNVAGRYSLSQVMPQFTWIEGIDNVKILFFEKINEVFKDFDLKPTWEKKRVKFDYRSVFDEETKNFVDKFYHQDFELFGYDKKL
jgi:hypothetical protein